MTAAMTLLDLEASIYAAYARMVRFPAGWTDDQRNQYLSDQAGSLVVAGHNLVRTVAGVL